MRPITISMAFVAADTDGVCQSQTPGAGGNLTINGALASGGVATLATGAFERQVLMTFAADETGRTFTIYGTNGAGNTISEAVAGAAATATTTKGFKTVTRVAIDAASAGAIQVGTNGVGWSSPIPCDIYLNPYNVNIDVNVTGTINFTVQQTPDNVFVDDTGALFWSDITALASKSADTAAVQTTPVGAYRVKQNSFTGGSLVARFVQAGAL